MLDLEELKNFLLALPSLGSEKQEPTAHFTQLVHKKISCIDCRMKVLGAPDADTMRALYEGILCESADPEMGASEEDLQMLLGLRGL